MNLPNPELPQVHLRPGELLVTQDPQWVITILGSCVAVTMFSARFNLAAICHAMLPCPRHNDHVPRNDPRRFRFLSHAVPAMLEPFHRAGIRSGEIDVKMFGGGNVIHLGGEPNDDRWIGSTNVKSARELLHESQLRLKAESVGGTRGRKIIFSTVTGEVLHKQLSSGSARSLALALCGKDAK